MLSTSFSKIMIRFTSVLLEVIKEPTDGFLVIVALLAFNDNLRPKCDVDRCGTNERVS